MAPIVPRNHVVGLPRRITVAKAFTLIELFGLEFSVCKLDSFGNDG
jgi:hypothetical protein